MIPSVFILVFYVVANIRIPFQIRKAFTIVFESVSCHGHASALEEEVPLQQGAEIGFVVLRVHRACMVGDWSLWVSLRRSGSGGCFVCKK